MRILLVQPPLTPEGPVQPPVGLAAIAAWLLKLGHDPRILDLDLFVRQRPGSGWSGCIAEFDRQLEELSPEVVGLTSMYSNSLHAGRLIARSRARLPKAITLAGGSHFGALPRESLVRYPELDFVIQGEGEGPLAAFMDQCAADQDWLQVPGLAWRDGNKVIVNDPGSLLDLAELPDPWAIPRAVLDPFEYIATDRAPSGERVAYVEAGRGCPFSCSFCSTAPFWRRKYRVKRPEQIVLELRRLQVFGYTRFILVHDLLTANTRFVSDLCDAILASQLPIRWMANSRTDIELKGLLPRMKAAGCWKLFFGIETASEAMQAVIDKHLAIQDAYTTIAELGRHGLTATCSFVIGYPTESRENLSRSIGAGARLKVLGAEIVQFHRLRIWPPAPLATQVLNQTFDAVSVAIEYPFLELPDDDVTSIAADREFFTGYFPPVSNAGSSELIAQLEMFTHHAVGVAPMTIYLLNSFRPGSLVDAFCSALDRLGALSRSDLDWDGGRILQSWSAIRPYLMAMAASVALHHQEATLVSETLAYEDQRVQFAGSHSAFSAQRSSHEFQSGVNIPELIRRIQSADVLDSGLLRQTQITFRWSEAGRFDCFAM